MRTFKTLYPPELKAVVKKITVITDDNPFAVQNSIPYFADGLPGIYFQESGHDIILNRNERKLSRLFLYGQTVKPITISTIGTFKAIIVHFFPPALKSLYGIDAHELTDTCMDYSLLPGAEAADLKDRLLEETNTSIQISILVNAVRRLLHTIRPATNGELYYATNRISRSGGAISLPSLQKELKISERTFQRRFLQHVGITPRLYIRICKFYAVLNVLESHSFHKLTDLAYDHGFSDQSHFNRTFKEFTGYTPVEYLVHFTDVELENK